MAIIAGKNSRIKFPGALVATVGEATTEDVTQKKYQITNTAKRVLQRTGTINVHKYSANGTAEDDTTTTNIEITGHGLATGDLIVNTSRSNAKRIITKVDNNNFTVSAITGQVQGDTIQKCPIESSSNYTLNRLIGRVTYASATSRTIYITAGYYPLTSVSDVSEFSQSIEANNEDISDFEGDGHVERVQGLLDVKGSLSGFYIDSTYQTLIIDGTIVVIEFFVDKNGVFDSKAWALLSNVEASTGVDGVVELSCDYEGVYDDDKRVIALGTE